MESKPQKLKWVMLAMLVLLLVVGVWIYFHRESLLLNPGSVEKVAELPYAQLTFSRLANRVPMPGNIEIGKVIAETPEYTSYVFYYHSGGKKISGQLNLPNLSRTMSAIVMARGYVAKEEYTTGIGTKNAAAVYAKNGYITLAPDFLGYGESDQEDADSIGARLYRPVEILDLLSSLSSLPQIDLTRVYLWGHSNGGQIMLSVAEILGKSDPRGRTSRILGMVLWAPVSKPFPFNILAFSDEADDQGKLLRKVVANFEKDYDVFDYSIDRYFDAINIPIQLHQGSADPEVFKVWSDDLAKELKDKKKDITYFVYPGANHNLSPGWNEVVARDLNFFQSHL